MSAISNTSKKDPASAPGPSMWVVAISHGAAVMIILAVCGFGFPLFPKFQFPEEDDRLSGPAVLIIKLSGQTNQRPVVPIAATCAFIVTDVFSTRGSATMLEMWPLLGFGASWRC